MQDYSVYTHGPDGHSYNLRCRNEAEAIKLAKQFVTDHDVELWQLDRQIETFRPHVRAGQYLSRLLPGDAH